MSATGRLFKELFKVCNNGCIPNLKLVGALANSHGTKSIYHSNEDPEVWAPRAGGLLRCLAGKWRHLARDKDMLERCLRKAYNRLGNFKMLIETLGSLCGLNENQRLYIIYINIKNIISIKMKSAGSKAGGDFDAPGTQVLIL